MAQLDTTFVRNIRLNIVVGHDAWAELKPQQILLSVFLNKSTGKAAESDDIEHALDYRNIYEAILSMGMESYNHKEDFIKDAVFRIVMTTGERHGSLRAEFPKAMLRAEGGLVMNATFKPRGDSSGFELIVGEISLLNVRLSCIIGIGDSERVVRQPVIVNLACKREEFGLSEYTLSDVFEVFMQKMEASECFTVERLVSRAVRYLFTNCEHLREAQINMLVLKPSVFGGADGPGVEITRTIQDFPELCKQGYMQAEEDLTI